MYIHLLKCWHLTCIYEWRPQQSSAWVLLAYIFFVFKVVIYKFFSFSCGLQVINTVSSFICHILMVRSMYELVSSEDVRCYLSGFLQLSHTTYAPPISISILSFPIHQCIYTGESSFPLSHLLSIHTHLSTIFSPFPPAPPFSLPFSCSVCFASAQ